MKLWMRCSSRWFCCFILSAFSIDDLFAHPSSNGSVVRRMKPLINASFDWQPMWACKWWRCRPMTATRHRMWTFTSRAEQKKMMRIYHPMFSADRICPTPKLAIRKMNSNRRQQMRFPSHTHGVWPKSNCKQFFTSSIKIKCEKI